MCPCLPPITHLRIRNRSNLISRKSNLAVLTFGPVFKFFYIQTLKSAMTRVHPCQWSNYRCALACVYFPFVVWCESFARRTSLYVSEWGKYSWLASTRRCCGQRTEGFLVAGKSCLFPWASNVHTVVVSLGRWWAWTSTPTVDMAELQLPSGVTGVQSHRRRPRGVAVWLQS